MRRLTARSRVVAAVLVALGSISFFIGAFGTGSPASASPSSARSSAASISSLTSPNGLYSIEVTNTGITLIGPAASVKLGPTNIEIEATKIELNGCTHAVASAGDLVNSAGVIANGNPTVCEA